MRRAWVLLLLLTAWLPALAGATVDPRGIPLATTPSLSVHALGLAQPAQASHAQAAPEAPVPIEGGPAPAGGRAARPESRHGGGRTAAAAPRAVNLHRLDWVRALDRARTGFLTTSSSTAPPTHG